MSGDLPAPAEVRLRRKVSDRARWTGYGILGLYAVVTIGLIFLFRARLFIFFFTGAGLAAGFRYLRAARYLEEASEPITDPRTRRLVGRLEQKIRRERQRDVAGGAVSIAAEAGTGAVSIAEAKRGQLGYSSPRESDDPEASSS